MEGNQYIHITISKCIIIENTLGIAIYGHTYNIMQTILVGNIYHIILESIKGHSTGHFWFKTLACHLPPTYILLYLHT